MNELMTREFEIDFKPSEITIQREDELRKLVDETANYYQSLVFTDDNTDEAKKARADLNKVIRKIDDQRKSVKREYNSPLKEFEGKLNNYTSQLKNVAQTISDGLNEFEEKQRNLREDEILKVIDEMTPNYEIGDVAIGIQPEWLNKTAFTKKGKPTKGTIEKIAYAMKVISDERKRIETNEKMITKYAETLGLGPESWTMYAIEGDVTKVTDRMDKAVVQKEERKRQEEQRKAALEVAEQTKVATESNQNIKVVDTKTGEIIEPEPEPIKDKEEPFKFYKVFGAPRQLDELEDYLILQGYEFETVGD